MQTETKRILYLDSARGFTVFIMPAVHTVMLYGAPEVRTSLFGLVLAFLSEGPGAQLFMFLMGLGIMISRPKTPSFIFRRTVVLFLAGYVLNLIRMVIPAALGVLPPALIAPYVVYPDLPHLSLLLTGDILAFAAMAYLVCSLIGLCKSPVAVIGTSYVLALILSVWCRDLRVAGWLPDHLAGLLFAADYRAFFPFFPWICYPLAGLLAGLVIRKIGADAFAGNVWKAGLAIMGMGAVLTFVSPADWEGDFYRSGPGRTIFQTGFVMVWTGLAAGLTRMWGQSLFFRLLYFCSRHITLIYLVQWILIAWGTGIFGFQGLNLAQSFLVSVLTTMASFGITRMIINRKRFIRVNKPGSVLSSFSNNHNPSL